MFWHWRSIAATGCYIPQRLSQPFLAGRRHLYETLDHWNLDLEYEPLKREDRAMIIPPVVEKFLTGDADA